MKYVSTRDESESRRVSAAEAILEGLAGDGGLYMPQTVPRLGKGELEQIGKLPYAERAAQILKKFLPDYNDAVLLASCREAYAEDKFPGGPAPLHRLSDQTHVLELWHGPTCAFKDMALQLMPRLLSSALKITGEKRTALILVATSGDTGKAALEGFRDVEGVKIMVFYPVDGVSKIQKLQMMTQEGKNVCVCAIRGNFDDAQNGVKSIFSDSEAQHALAECNSFFSSANSINWGRLVPQIVYYISAYCDLVNSGTIQSGEAINISVPTGNFGNIFAGYLAKEMGLPVKRFICASNRNNILTDFLDSGVYDRNRRFYTTMSPSMDILISSNLERLLYLKAGAARTARYMRSLRDKGAYRVEDEVYQNISSDISGLFCNEEQTAQTIRRTFETYHYLCDTHTAVGLFCAEKFLEQTQDNAKTLVVSTASPYKFAVDVYQALTGERAADEMASLDLLSSYTGTAVPRQLGSLKEKAVRFDRVVDSGDMMAEVLNFAG